MDISTLGPATPVATESIISWAVAVIAVAAAFAIKPILRKRKASLVGSGLLVVMAVIVAMMGAVLGFTHEGGVQARADNATFHEKLKADYGVETDSDLSEVERSARYERIIVLTGASGSFEVRPHVDGTTLTFFRVDNGSQVAPRS